MDTVDTTLIAHKREAEWLFAAAAFFNPQTAVHDCGWLNPSHLQDAQVRQFWIDLRDGKAADKAAIDAGIFYKLTGYMTGQTFSPSYMASFAAAIAEDIYMIDVAGAIGEIAKALADRDLSGVQTRIGELAEARPLGNVPISDAADAGLEFLASLDDVDRSIKTDIPSLDRSLGGFERQTLTLLAARPSMGKTSLGLQLIRACVDNGGKGIYFSLEMAKRILWARMACGKVRVDYRDYRARRLTPEQKEAVTQATNELMEQYGRGLWIDDRSRIGSREIWQAVSAYHPDMIVVDHLGLVQETEKDEVKALHNIAWVGKQIAKEFDCAAVYLYQLNRGTESRDNKRPTMSDLRGSGRLEEDADQILFLYRADYYAPPSGPLTVSDTELITAKDRGGTRNVCTHLMYRLDEQYFYPKERELP